jgi:hypothetical protein
MLNWHSCYKCPDKAPLLCSGGSQQKPIDKYLVVSFIYTLNSTVDTWWYGTYKYKEWWRLLMIMKRTVGLLSD